MAIGNAAAVASDAGHRRQFHRAVIASTIGTAIEWYDFFLYGTVTGLAFAKLYFPNSEPLTGTLLAFSTYAVGFIARPIGAAIFGHYGDRIGRKSTLVITLMLMGTATFAVGLVPSYAAIGVWGSVILTVLRFIQGIGVGGEWGGSVLLSMEWAQTNNHRGFITSWPQFGVPLGLGLANLAVLMFSNLSDADFLAWGWRIPFLFSIVLLGVGLYIRLGVLETPTFRRLQAANAIERRPSLAVLKEQPKAVILSALARAGQQSAFYIFTTFVFVYGTTALHQPRRFLLYAVLAASVVSCFTIPLFGHLSDRIGRKRIYLAGNVVSALYVFVYFALLQTGVPLWTFAAIAVSLGLHDMTYGPQAALIAECFTGRLRYSGASLGYQLASLIAGGPAPLIATALLARYGSGMAIAIYLAINFAISFVATVYMTDRTGKDIDNRE